MEPLKQMYTKGRLIDYGISKNGNGEPQVTASFDVEMNDKNKTPFEGDGSNVKRMLWFGHLASEKSREITIKAILVLGFVGKELSEIQKGLEGNALDAGRIVDLNCGEETYEGKTRWKINFVNAPGGGAGKVESIDATETKKLLGELNLKAVLDGVKKDNPNLVEVAKRGTDSKPDAF